MEVLILSLDGLDSSYSISVREQEWEAKLGMRPILTEFFPDHKYRREYRDLQDSLTQVNRGIWNLFGDTLMLIEPGATYQYKLRLEGDFLRFETYLDWDGDGVEDDEYTGMQKKIKN